MKRWRSNRRQREEVEEVQQQQQQQRDSPRQQGNNRKSEKRKQQQQQSTHTNDKNDDDIVDIQQQDLSNLWSRKESIEGNIGIQNNRSGSSQCSYYPVVKEHNFRVPSTDALLNKQLPYQINKNKNAGKKTSKRNILMKSKNKNEIEQQQTDETYDCAEEKTTNTFTKITTTTVTSNCDNDGPVSVDVVIEEKSLSDNKKLLISETTTNTATTTTSVDNNMNTQKEEKDSYKVNNGFAKTTTTTTKDPSGVLLFTNNNKKDPTGVIPKKDISLYMESNSVLASVAPSVMLSSSQPMKDDNNNNKSSNIQTTTTTTSNGRMFNNNNQLLMKVDDNNNNNSIQQNTKIPEFTLPERLKNPNAVKEAIWGNQKIKQPIHSSSDDNNNNDNSSNNVKIENSASTLPLNLRNSDSVKQALWGNQQATGPAYATMTDNQTNGMPLFGKPTTKKRLSLEDDHDDIGHPSVIAASLTAKMNTTNLLDDSNEDDSNSSSSIERKPAAKNPLFGNNGNKVHTQWNGGTPQNDDIPLFGREKQTGKSLEDDDDDDDFTRKRPPVFATTQTPTNNVPLYGRKPATNSANKSHSIVGAHQQNGGLNVLGKYSENMNIATTKTSQDEKNDGDDDRTPSVQSSPVWGRRVAKAKKTTLEDDTPNSQEIAFAEGTTGLKMPLSDNVESIPPKYDGNNAQTDVESFKPVSTDRPKTTTLGKNDAASTSLTEQEQIEKAILESKKQHEHDQHQQAKETTGALLTRYDAELARENAHSIRSMTTNAKDIDFDFLQSVLSLCKADQKKIADAIEALMLTPEVDDDEHIGLEELIDLNSNVLDAIEIGEKITDNHIKPPAKNRRTTNLDVQDLVHAHDVFSLICMLRVHENEKRLDAAVALMRFARAAEKEKNPETIQLRNEIRSTGGIHSLLTLYRTKGIVYNLKAICALAVAYVLPSFVESSTHTPPELGIKIVECLSFLATAEAVSHNDEIIETEEMSRTALNALASFWLNHLEPMLQSKRNTMVDSIDQRKLKRSISAGRQNNRRGAHLRQESVAMDELLELTVSLIIFIAKQETNNENKNRKKTDESMKWSLTLIEQLCAVQIARPIAVRGGILQILVTWIHSKDREQVQAAASALRYLTSIEDKYMAGWIHSEMINKGAVQGISDLTHDLSVTRDVRLAITQILSSLCAAPHTRAAVVEANCVNFLIGVLYDHSDPSSDDLAFYAGSAILQLTAGAIARASALTANDHEQIGYLLADKRDSLVSDIVESGAIASFVSIAETKSSRLRSMAVRALRVISEDTGAKRQTRLQLCEDAAARALGKTLRDIMMSLGDPIDNLSLEKFRKEEEESMTDLYEALIALANILDPIQDNFSRTDFRSMSSSSGKDQQFLLIKGCLETADSGGLESLLKIASLPLEKEADSPGLELLEEACRSLALIAPLLFTDKASKKGYSRWSHDVFVALHCVLRSLNSFDDDNCYLINEGVDLYVNVLQGIASLSRSDPLKIRIVDKTLPFLLKARNVNDQSDVSNAAGHAILSLDLAEDEIIAQMAGNTPNLFADLFCLQRSLLLQAMARAEFRSFLLRAWQIPFEEVDHKFSMLVRERSRSPRPDSNNGENEIKEQLFFNFADDEDTVEMRSSLLSQYGNVYGCRHADGLLSDEQLDSAPSLLSNQIYPLNSCTAETEWILEHMKAISEPSRFSFDHSEHVKKLLGYCFPSIMLRDQEVPIHTLNPEASFNFRAIMMPQRRYFSFRREGQLLAYLCDTETALDTHYTLGFTNSSFAGEFSESLVQVLYKCPMIRGLSFVRNADWDGTFAKEDKEKTEESSGALLANLAGSLPPWISHLTFEGLFDDVDLRTLVFILETMGKLSASQRTSTGVDGAKQSRGQGEFCFFAIRGSPNLSADAWFPFFDLLRGNESFRNVPSANTLSSLKALDLSGNNLDDNLCATILEIIYDDSSGCLLEQLDLARNRIGSAQKTLQVFRAYCNKHSSGSSKKSKLHTLSLAGNGLLGKVWLEIVSLVRKKGLELKSLDLSDNSLTLIERESDFVDLVVQTLSSNPSMERLNLSCNNFLPRTIDRMLNAMDEEYCGHAIIQLDENNPLLSDEQLQLLEKVTTTTRKRVLEHYIWERENTSIDGKQENDMEPMETLLSEKSRGKQTIAEEAPLKSIESLSASDKMEIQPLPGDNSITVLFSAPLVFTDGRNLRPFAKLDFDMERELMWQCLKEASRDIELSFDSATHDRLLATMAKRCSCLHYSGHGHQEYLPFEDGCGGPYWFKVDQFKSLIEQEGGAPFRFVFVSACYSYLAGETFASAGVPHVVCCQQESELKDTAALAFTRQFYLALAIGHTVKDSFDLGCKAVRATPNLRNPDVEMQKFLLLPKDGNHDIPIFNAKSVPEWPKHSSSSYSSRRPSRASMLRVSRILLSGARGSELSVRNMIQEDPSPSPPEFFLGREVDMYYVLKAVLTKRLVSVVGEPGIGRSSLVCALCHYINERATTMISIDHIYYIKARRQSRKRSPFRSVVQRFMKKLVEEEKARPATTDADMETLFDTICRALKHEKALVVFDRVEHFSDSDATEFPVLLSKLCRETKNVKVLLTNRSDLGIPSLGEHPISLGPLNFADTVRLFANICPFLHTPADRKKLFEILVTDGEKAEVFATDPELGSATKRIFGILGDGIPSKIEKAAYDLTKESFLQLYKGTQ